MEFGGFDSYMSLKRQDNRDRSSAKSRSPSRCAKFHCLPHGVVSSACLFTESKATKNNVGESRQPCFTPVTI